MDILVRQDPGGPLECSSDHASDYYGLGVRLGIYFSWLSGWLANTFLSSGISGAADTNTIFLFTLLIAMTVDANNDWLFQIDGLVLMHLCSGTIFGMLSVWGYRTRLYTEYGPRAIGLFGSYGTHIRMMTSLAVSVFGIWFWTVGLDGKAQVMGPGDGVTDPRPNPVECGELYTFLFVKLRADSGIRWFYVAVSCMCALYFGIMVIVSSLSVWFTFERLFARAKLHRRDSRWAGAAGRSEGLARPSYVTGFTSGECKVVFKVLRVSTLIWLLFSAVNVEMTLNFNHIYGVLGNPENNALQLPGQLLPFLVGLLSFLRTCYALYIERWVDRHEKPMSLLPPEQGDPETIQGGSSISRHRRVRQEQGDIGPDGRRLRRTTSGHDRVQKSRGWVVRYLVAWLPWLSLLQHYDDQLENLGITRSSTSLAAYNMPRIDEGMGMEDDRERLLAKSMSEAVVRDVRSP